MYYIHNHDCTIAFPPVRAYNPTTQQTAKNPVEDNFYPPLWTSLSGEALDCVDEYKTDNPSDHCLDLIALYEDDKLGYVVGNDIVIFDDRSNRLIDDRI